MNGGEHTEQYRMGPPLKTRSYKLSYKLLCIRDLLSFYNVEFPGVRIEGYNCTFY